MRSMYTCMWNPMGADASRWMRSCAGPPRRTSRRVGIGPRPWRRLPGTTVSAGWRGGGGAGDQAAVLRSDAARRCGGRLSVADGDPGSPVGAVAGCGDLDGHPQGQRLHRPVGVVAEVLSAAVGSRGEWAAQAEGAVRFGL